MYGAVNQGGGAMMRLLVAGLFAVLGAGCNAADNAPTGTGSVDMNALRFSPTGQSGRFDLENTGAEVSLRSRLQVEKRVDGQWRPVASELYIADTCSASEPPACRKLKSGEKIRLLRYQGFTCNMDCPPGCMANAQLSPGTFRLIALSCDGTQRVLGGEFDLK